MSAILDQTSWLNIEGENRENPKLVALRQRIAALTVLESSVDVRYERRDKRGDGSSAQILGDIFPVSTDGETFRSLDELRKAREETLAAIQAITGDVVEMEG